MQTQELSRQLQRLEDLFNRTAIASNNDIEAQAHWARYLCVLTAGFIEKAICLVYIDFVKNAASEPVAHFAIQKLSQIQNPNTPRILETARSFKANWADELSKYMEQEGRRDAIDSVMANRHLIAHGKDSNISIVRLKEWFKKSIEVIEFVENQCKH